MKKIHIFFLLFLISIASLAQRPRKTITEDAVGRMLETLSSDAMGGRPAIEPGVIEEAARFLEKEFRAAGLKPFGQLQGFRQEFEEQTIQLSLEQYVVNGRPLPVDQAVVLSDEENIWLSTGAKVQRARNGDDLFSLLRKARRDSTSSVIIADTSFRDRMATFREFYSRKRIKSSRPGATVAIIMSADSVTAFDIRATQAITAIRMTNIVGQLPAHEPTSASIVYSGHYDHLGTRPSTAGDSIANGADDDASGTTAVAQLARFFKSVKDRKRNLIFVAFTAEEIGGYGSQYFSKQIPPEHVVAMINVEMIGKPSKWGMNAAFLTGFELSDLGALMQKNLEGSGFQLMPDPYPQQNLFYRSDNATLARLGVPAHTFSTDQIDTDTLYHTVDDEFETLSIPNVTAAIRAIAIATLPLVRGQQTPSRIDATKVR